jgi:hypothetical protein
MATQPFQFNTQVKVLPMGFLKQCIQRIYSDAKNVEARYVFSMVYGHCPPLLTASR